ncbi:UMP-CMP kinase [Bradysia coprophila]|uniref:UMP-CMP kinase n=1 Tax=Bradysia coprophila TaxID=38358 RepID=UPI00187DB052|nr:UMP-CMP kinase [Bradysia coprophila]
MTKFLFLMNTKFLLMVSSIPQKVLSNYIGHRQPFFFRTFTGTQLLSFSKFIATYYNKTVVMPEKPKVVFVLGAPGAGKGTQCSNIVKMYGYAHLSAGDLLREERQRSGSEFGELIDDCILNGKIVPVAVTCSLLENAMKKCFGETGANKFLIDGFPRNRDNLDGWTLQMSEKVDLQFVIVFDCTEEVCIERCLKRGAGGSGRTDDNLESLKKRFLTFYNDSLPIIEFYEAKKLVRKINGVADPDTVFKNVKTVFNELNA